MFLIKIFLLFFILLIGFSRLYLGAHSLDQILFGWNNSIIFMFFYLNFFKKRIHYFLK
jgi:membrane-associated phospholipid phosphatase